MATTKSAWKRYIQSEKRNVANRAARSAVRTQVKKALEEIATSKTSPNTGEVRLAVQALARSGSKGLCHKKTAARRISRLMKRANKASA